MDSASVVEGSAAGSYLYTERRSEYGAHHITVQDPQRTWVYTQPQHWQDWRGDDGTGLMRVERGPARFFTPEGKRRWEVAGQPELPSGRHDMVFASGCMEGRRSRERAARLPSGPSELRAAIEQRRPARGLGDHEEDFLTIGDLLREPCMPAGACRALYRLAIVLPGVRDLGEMTDRAERTGLGIEMDADGYLRRLIFDGDSHRLIEMQDTLTNPEYDYAPVGTVTGWQLFLQEKHLDSLPADAPATPGPPCPPGQAPMMREVAPGLSHATGRPAEP